MGLVSHRICGAKNMNSTLRSRDYGSKRGFPNESGKCSALSDLVDGIVWFTLLYCITEYTVVKADFYNNIKTYLAELENTNIRSLEDIVAYNDANVGTEGGIPGMHPAFASGQVTEDCAGSILVLIVHRTDSSPVFLRRVSGTRHTGKLLHSANVRREKKASMRAHLCSRKRRQSADILCYYSALRYIKADGNPGTLDGLLVPSDTAVTYQIAAQAGMHGSYLLILPADWLVRLSHDYNSGRDQLVRYAVWARNNEYGLDRTAPHQMGFSDRDHLAQAAYAEVVDVYGKKHTCQSGAGLSYRTRSMHMLD
jgi:hypothetical protein